MNEDVRATWQAVAPAWERHRTLIHEGTRPVSDRLITLLDPRAGQTILEIACGTGDMGFDIAERLRPGGWLIQTDLAEAMLAAAQRGARARGAVNIDHRVVDAQAMEVPTWSVDGIVSRFAFMLMPDPAAAFRECRRVLRPGGALAFAVWGSPERNAWVAVVALPLLKAGALEPSDPAGPGGMFSLADADKVQTMLRDAGFPHITTEEVLLTTRIEDFDVWWSYQSEIAGPLAVALSALGSDEQQGIRDAARALCEPFRVGSAYELPGCALVIRAL